jgi:putative nucleotidyltransferase with HDIG domain
MSETVKVACPGCDAIFAIPVELGGELGECTECDTVFEIPEINVAKPQEEVKPIIPKMSAEDIEATGTVKLSRASIGMIPDLKDAFNFGVDDDKSTIHTSHMAEVFATPAQNAIPQPAPEPKPEPVRPRHGGLQIAKSKTLPTTSHNPAPQPQAPAGKKKSEKQKPKPAPQAAKKPGIESIIITEDGLSEKDKIATLLLCLLLGMFGAHRFYVGKIITGFFMMITLGGLGIWCFIDLIMIVTDNFRDVKGNPIKGTDVISDITDEELKYQNKLVGTDSTSDETINTIMDALFEKSVAVKEHSMRVSELAVSIAEKMGLSETNTNDIKKMGLIHDIGKIVIDLHIFDKPGKLTKAEKKIIQQHPLSGSRMLNSSHEYARLVAGVLHHHERIDGTGYPSGITGDQIPIESKIIAVADAFDAMTADRPYRLTPLSLERAISELQKYSGTQFDKTIVDVLINKVLVNNEGDDKGILNKTEIITKGSS